jgi:hypothetical protein
LCRFGGKHEHVATPRRHFGAFFGIKDNRQLRKAQYPLGELLLLVACLTRTRCPAG